MSPLSCLRLATGQHDQYPTKGIVSSAAGDDLARLPQVSPHSMKTNAPTMMMTTTTPCSLQQLCRSSAYKQSHCCSSTRALTAIRKLMYMSMVSLQ